MSRYDWSSNHLERHRPSGVQCAHNAGARGKGMGGTRVSEVEEDGKKSYHQLKCTCVKICIT